jgi:hypothetical protein
MTRYLLLAALLTACGPGSKADTGDSAGSTTGGSADTGDSTRPASTDTGDVPTSPLSSDTTPTTSSEDVTGVTTEITSLDVTGVATEITSTSDATGDDTNSSTTGVPADEQYVAFYFAGGLDHLLIHKANILEDRCTIVHITHPGNQVLDITVPEMWEVQSGVISEGIEGCLAMEGMPPGTPVAADAGTGAISWRTDPMQLCPVMVDVDISLKFPQDQPWVPAEELLKISGLPVEGCP